MNNSTCAMVHPSSTAVPLLAMERAGGAHVEARQAHRGDERVLHRAGRRACINETVVTAGRADHRHLRACARSRHPLRLSEVWREGELRLASGRCGRGAGDGRQHAAGRLRLCLASRLPRRIRSAAAEAHSDRQAVIDEATARAAAKAAMQPRHAAFAERLQNATVSDRDLSHHFAGGRTDAARSERDRLRRPT